MNIRPGELMCSGLPLLCWFMDSIAQLFAAAAAATSRSLIGVSGENMLNTQENDASTVANVEAQKHFRQSQLVFKI